MTLTSIAHSAIAKATAASAKAVAAVKATTAASAGGAAAAATTTFDTSVYVRVAIIAGVFAVVSQVASALITWLREHLSRVRREARAKRIFGSIVRSIDERLSWAVNDSVLIDPEHLDAPIAALRKAIDNTSVLLELEPGTIAKLYLLAETTDAALGFFRSRVAEFRERSHIRPGDIVAADRDGLITVARNAFARSLAASFDALEVLDDAQINDLAARNLKAATNDPEHPQHHRANGSRRERDLRLD